MEKFVFTDNCILHQLFYPFWGETKFLRDYIVDDEVKTVFLSQISFGYAASFI